MESSFAGSRVQPLSNIVPFPIQALDFAFGFSQLAVQQRELALQCRGVDLHAL